MSGPSLNTAAVSTSTSATLNTSAPARTPLDVETTNWNAIKIIAVQHGIPSNILQQLRDCFANPGSVDSSQDFGEGTPYHITVTCSGSGRHNYRFRTRQPANDGGARTSPDDDHDNNDFQSGMARSSSSGAVYTHSHTHIHTQLGSADPPSSQGKGGLGASLSRMTANKSLKQSRSIPVLRRKPNSNIVPKLPALTTAGPALSAAPTSTDLNLTSSRRYDNDSSPTSSPVEQTRPTVRRSSKSPKAPFAMQHLVGNLEEGDVLGAVLGLRQQNLWSQDPQSSTSSQSMDDKKHLSPPKLWKPLSSSSGQDGRGLNLKQYQMSAFGQPLHVLQQNRPKSFDSSTVPPADVSMHKFGLIPELDMGATFAKSPQLHQLRETPSFESYASGYTARAPDQHSTSHLQATPDPRRHNDGASVPDSLIFDVLQYYDHPDPVGDSVLNALPHRIEPHSNLHHPKAEPATSAASSDNAAENAQGQHAAKAHALPTSAAPGDDPRFSLWAVQSEGQEGDFVVSNRNGRFARSDKGFAVLSASKSMTSTNCGLQSHRTPETGDEHVPKASPYSQESAYSGRTRTRSQNTSVSVSSTQSATLLAASITCLIAELTAEIDQDLLVDFFYTFRTFLDPVDLLQLLVLRFDWALMETCAAEDEARRRIVRVRTYVVIKFWLLHHFDHDFLPNRDLRQRLCAWLNRMAKDPRVTSRPADVSIVNSLRKIVRGLKGRYSRAGVGGLLLDEPGRMDEAAPDHSRASVKSIGSSSHDSVRTSGQNTLYTPVKTRDSGPQLLPEELNLDFSDDAQPQVMQSYGPVTADQISASTKQASPQPEQRCFVQTIEAGTTNMSPRQGTMTPSQPLRSSPFSSGNPQFSPASPPAPMPATSSALSRAFVQTVGRLSRFKRVLGNRGLGGDGSSDFDLDMGEFHDLLFVKGGVQSVLDFLDSAPPVAPRKTADQDVCRPATLKEEDEGEESELPHGQVSGDSTGREEARSLAEAASTRSTPASSVDLTAHSGKRLSTNASIGRDTVDDDVATDAREPLHHMASEQTLRSVSPALISQSQETRSPERVRRTSLMSVRSGARAFSQAFRGSSSIQAGPTIVQIDDIDLSSDDDDFAVRRALRRLPGARDLRHAKTVKDLNAATPGPRSSIDSLASSRYNGFSALSATKRGKMSSLGHGRSVSADSATMRTAPLEGPCVIGTVQTEMLDPDEALQGYELVKGFKLDDIESDDDEDSGGVEAALRRLEGIIDEDRQKEKAKRVERLWQRSLARNAQTSADDEGAAKHSSLLSRLSKAGRPASSSHTGGSLADIEDGSTSPSVDLADSLVYRPLDETSVRHQSLALKQAADATSDNVEAGAQRLGEQRNGGSDISPEADVSSKSLHPALAETPGSPVRQRKHILGAALSLSPSLNDRSMLPRHRSFVLSFRAETLARQMYLIEGELLRSVTWDELASSRWKQRRYSSEVNDWEVFYRDRVRDRVETQKVGKVYHEPGVEAIVSRFNLTSNWVASQVVLTQHPDERTAVVCKLIRVAWKCYLQSNFASLTQIIFGLSTPWVERLRKTWNRVGYYEMRIWKDLNSFVGPRNNFRHLRNAMLQLSDVSTAGVDSTGAVISSSGGCIPFFGLYLSDLMVNDSLPTFVDPSMPTHPADVGAGGSQLRAPHAFAHLPPLPEGISIDPLVNVVKFRKTASLIRQLASHQAAAAAAAAHAEARDVDKACYVRCLKLRSLPGEVLARLSHTIEP